MFQNQVYINPAQALPGDFASSNPMHYKLSGTGTMIADTSGVTVGKFAILNADGTVTSLPSAALAGQRLGFVHRENNAQIVTFLAEAGNMIQKGQPVSLFGAGDFFVNVDAITGTPVRGAQVWWDTVTGNTIVGAPGSPPATTVNTGFVLVSEIATVNAIVMISNIGNV
jgi:hypothetical protein